MNTLEFKKYNRKYIIVQSFDDTKLPADDEVLGEGVVIVYTPTGTLVEAEKCKIGDGLSTFSNLPWLGAEELNLQSKTVSPDANEQVVVADEGYDGLSSVTVNACSGTRNITSRSNTNVVGYRYAKVVDEDLAAENIKQGVSILGVVGTYEGEPHQPFEGELSLNLTCGDILIIDENLYQYLEPIDEEANGDGLIELIDYENSAEIVARRAGSINISFADGANGHYMSATLNISEPPHVSELLPELNNPASVADVTADTEFINSNGEKCIGTLKTTSTLLPYSAAYLSATSSYDPDTGLFSMPGYVILNSLNATQNPMSGYSLKLSTASMVPLPTATFSIGKPATVTFEIKITSTYYGQVNAVGSCPTARASVGPRICPTQCGATVNPSLGMPSPQSCSMSVLPGSILSFKCNPIPTKITLCNGIALVFDDPQLSLSDHKYICEVSDSFAGGVISIEF